MDSLLPLDVKIEREYDPLWPNDYEKVVKEMREAAAAKRTSEDPVEDRWEDTVCEVYKNISCVRDTDSPGGDKKRRYLVQSMGKARERFQAASGNTQVQQWFGNIFRVIVNIFGDPSNIFSISDQTLWVQRPAG